MTRLDALRRLLAQPRDKDMERIGHRVIDATADERKVRLSRLSRWQREADRILRRA